MMLGKTTTEKLARKAKLWVVFLTEIQTLTNTLFIST